MRTEVWKPIEESTIYEVSNLGNVRRLPTRVRKTDKPLTPIRRFNDKNERPVVCARIDGKPFRFRVNILVYRAFIGALPEKFQIDHCDGDFQNCAANNLKLADRYVAEEYDRRECGKKYGFWTALRRAGKDKYNNAMWLCRCECGSERRVSIGSLLNGKSRNCGCKNSEIRDANGDRNSCWRGGQNVPGSAPWVAKKIRTISLHSRKAGHCGITSSIESVQSLFVAANGKCAVCGTVPPDGKSLHLDHCHKTGVARGFLCNHCNVSIGMVGDSAERLRQLAAYLDASRPMLANNGAFDVHNFRITDGRIRAS